jgi:uncharacterized protein
LRTPTIGLLKWREATGLAAFKLRLAAIGIFCLVLCGGFVVPPLTGPVMDQAQMLNSITRETLDSALRRLYDSGGTQVVVLTVPSLEGETVEQASIQTTDKWRLGRQGKDDGILILIAQKERAIRIEVGRGREGDLTDLHARRIIDELMVPRFRAGDVDGGVVAGVRAVVGRTDPGVDLDAFGRVKSVPRRSERRGGGGLWLFLLIIVVFFLFSKGGGGPGSPFGRRRTWSSGSGGFGGWGGGSGGGGWSGGGGGFSGGGASGRW